MEVEEDSEGNLEDRLERLPNCTLPRKCPPSLCLVWIPSGIIEGIPLWSPSTLGRWGNGHWGGDDPRLDRPLVSMGKGDRPTAGNLTP